MEEQTRVRGPESTDPRCPCHVRLFAGFLSGAQSAGRSHRLLLYVYDILVNPSCQGRLLTTSLSNHHLAVHL